MTAATRLNEPGPNHAVADTAAWLDANQRGLVAALGTVRAALERRAAELRTLSHGERGQPFTGDSASDASASLGRSMTLDILTTSFGLSSFERDVVVLCAGMDLDGAFPALCAAAQGSGHLSYPTFGLALATLPGAHWSALAPRAPLRRWSLVELTPGASITTGALRIDERILHYLAGVGGLDIRLAGVVEPIARSGDVVPSHESIVDAVAAAWTTFESASPAPVIQLCGIGTRDAREIAAAAAERVGLTIAALTADLIPTIPAEADALARLWQRESMLGHGALLVDCDDLGDDDGMRSAAITRFIESVTTPVVIATREPRRLRHRASVPIDVGKPTTAEQITVWRAALGGAVAARLDGHVERLVGQFRLNAPTIRAVASGAVAPDTTSEVAERLWDRCRAQSRPALGGLAQRIEPAATWDALVLPEAQKQLLRDIASHVRQRVCVYERWGFARQNRRGLGLTSLFAGASGTGKTMAAEVLANELRLDLYRIDLASVVSKYIGETEKNLRRIFDAADDGGAILLFDEADALFGKRSEVKDAHDRYANIEVSYLLQQMEAYRGLAILTTNLRRALDTAFLRRILFVVEFPFPDVAQRSEIWSRVLPPDAPTDGLDVTRLARLNIAGGSIRNIALNAAFFAADATEPLRMTHMLRATRNEYAKMERVLTEAELVGWADRG